MITANRRELPLSPEDCAGKGALSALKRDVSQLFPPPGGKSTLPILALESRWRERYNALHPRDEQEPCVMTEREKLLSGTEYNSRDEELIAMYHRAWR